MPVCSSTSSCSPSSTSSSPSYDMLQPPGIVVYCSGVQNSMHEHGLGSCDPQQQTIWSQMQGTYYDLSSESPSRICNPCKGCLPPMTKCHPR